VLTIGESASVENEEGVWLAIADGGEEVVRARITRPEDEQPSEVSVWWNGSATARGVRDWVGETIELFDPRLECRGRVWAEDAPKETHSYRRESVSQLADDIQKWTDDGAVGCSITDAPHNHELVYMWAELRPGGSPSHTGEVGLQYETGALRTERGKRVFERLLQYTMPRQFSGDELDQLYDFVAKRVEHAAAHMSERRFRAEAAF